jgi:hypothetical protein
MKRMSRKNRRFFAISGCQKNGKKPEKSQEGKRLTGPQID